MGTTLWWLLDGLTLLIAGHIIFSNAKRGVAKVIIMCIGYTVVTLLASLFSAIAAPTLYDSIASHNNIVGLETANKHIDFVQVVTQAINDKRYGITIDKNKVKYCLEHTNEMPFDDALYQYCNNLAGGKVGDYDVFRNAICTAFVESYGKQLGERLPKYVRMEFENKYRNNPEAVITFMRDYYSTKYTYAEKMARLEDHICEQPTREVLQIFMYLILFSVFMVIVAVINAIAQQNIFINLTRTKDRVLGGLLGIMEAISILVLMTLIVRLIVMLTGDGWRILNETTVYETHIFQFLYKHLNILL